MDDHTLSLKDHIPRPITPEDDSYRDVMMLFSENPVKPKYWFEDFGDYWSCSCGQINRGEMCSNCGLDRELLRKLFSGAGDPASDGPSNGNVDSSSSNHASDGHVSGDKDSADRDDGSDQPEDSSAASAGDHTGGSSAVSAGYHTDGSSAASSAEDAVDFAESEALADDRYIRRKKITRRILLIIIILLVLLGGALAAFYFYVLPEMERRSQVQSNAVKDSIMRELPAVLDPMVDVDFASYKNAGDIMYEKKDYVKAIEYYNKALKIKDDENISQKILEAKFSYVSANQEEGGKTFNKYLNELKKANYPGINNIYERHYSWKASTVANTGYSDYSTDMSNISRQYTIYFHTTLKGGPPDEKLSLYYEVIWPDGSSERRTVPGSKGEGETVTTRCEYTYPATSNEGKLTYKIYNNDDHQLMATDSVTLEL